MPWMIERTIRASPDISPGPRLVTDVAVVLAVLLLQRVLAGARFRRRFAGGFAGLVWFGGGPLREVRSWFAAMVATETMHEKGIWTPYRSPDAVFTNSGCARHNVTS